MRNRTRQGGSVTIWLLGLGICLLVLGGLGLDLWSALVVHSRLAGMAEAIAAAAASGISEEHWRRTGQIRLDPRRAERLGRSLAARHPGALALEFPPEVVVDSDLRRVSVRVRGATRLTLLRLVSESERMEVEVTSVSEPQVVG